MQTRVALGLCALGLWGPLSACAGPAAARAVPALVLGASAAGGRSPGHEQRRWRVEAGLRWGLREAATDFEDDAPRTRPRFEPTPCEHTSLCAWERARRARAMARWRGRTP